MVGPCQLLVQVSRGVHGNILFLLFRNDIESVSVRAGCTFVGFDDSSLNGRSMTIRAGVKDR